jgi:hypothetical protein
VTEDAREFVRALGPFDESSKDIYGTTRDGKSVELIFIDDKEPVIERLRSCGSENSPPHAVDVTLGFGMAYEFEMLSCLAAELAANSDFVVLSRRTYTRYRGQILRQGAAAGNKNRYDKNQRTNGAAAPKRRRARFHLWIIESASESFNSNN